MALRKSVYLKEIKRKLKDVATEWEAQGRRVFGGGKIRLSSGYVHRGDA